MRKRGTCTNCERPEMALFYPDDICGSCNMARSKAQPGKEKESLAAAREKYRGKPKLGRGRRTKMQEKREKPGTKPRIITGKKDVPPAIPACATMEQLISLMKEGIGIFLCFESDEDKKLLKAIKAAAKRSRRTTDQ